MFQFVWRYFFASDSMLVHIAFVFATDFIVYHLTKATALGCNDIRCQIAKLIISG